MMAMETIKQGSIEDALRLTGSGDQSKAENPENTNDVSAEPMELEVTESAEKVEAARTLELRRKARQIQVSTDDTEVKAYLRQLREPICFFGEDAADRRERLRQLLALLGESALRKPLTSAGTSTSSGKAEVETNTVWYHEGPPTLKVARAFIAEYSLPKARDRLEAAREYYSRVPEAQRKARQQEFHKKLRTSLSSDCSQIGDTRPLSFCQFSPSGNHLATASWSGVCKVWRVPSCESHLTFRGHNSKAWCAVWHPQATLQSNLPLALATSAQDGSVRLWGLDSEESIAEMDLFRGSPAHRVSRMAFHPSGRFLAMACFDWSWRLWDLEIAEEVLHQEGHSEAVYDVASHPDGSLMLSGGLDSFGRVWDLRTGRCIMFLEGHLQGVLSVSWSHNGYHMLTASEDNTCKVWDLRQQSCIYTIPAHTNTISAAKFQPQDSQYIISSSYDNTLKLWGHPIWTPIRTLAGHEGKVMHVDVSPKNDFIASCSFDRHFKLWSLE